MSLNRMSIGTLERPIIWHCRLYQVFWSWFHIGNMPEHKVKIMWILSNTSTLIITFLLKFIINFSILPTLKVYAMVGRDHNFSLIILEDVKIFMLQTLKEHNWTALWFYVNIALVSNYRTIWPSCFHNYLVYCKSDELIRQLGKSKLKLIAYRNWSFFQWRKQNLEMYF